MPVLGMGGLFFRAKNPDALNAWYKEHLGVGAGCNATGGGDTDEWTWQVTGGAMVFAPFKADTDYFPADKQFMLNFRVSDIDSLMDNLNAAGIEVITTEAWDSSGMGKFARIHDPEGNAIELWEPPVE